MTVMPTRDWSPWRLPGRRGDMVRKSMNNAR